MPGESCKKTIDHGNKQDETSKNVTIVCEGLLNPFPRISMSLDLTRNTATRTLHAIQ